MALVVVKVVWPAALVVPLVVVMVELPLPLARVMVFRGGGFRRRCDRGGEGGGGGAVATTDAGGAVRVEAVALAAAVLTVMGLLAPLALGSLALIVWLPAVEGGGEGGAALSAPVEL